MKRKIVIKYTPFGIRADLYKKTLFWWSWEAGHVVEGSSIIIFPLRFHIREWCEKFNVTIENKTKESLDFL